MTDNQYFKIFYDAIDNGDHMERDAFVSDWALSNIWGDDINSPIPQDRLDAIGSIWDAAHLTIRDIRAKTGLSQAAFGERYCIPRRTIENWESGTRSCPPYVRLLLARAVGMA